jgi:hypothetical protein
VIFGLIEFGLINLARLSTQCYELCNVRCTRFCNVKNCFRVLLKKILHEDKIYLYIRNLNDNRLIIHEGMEHATWPLYIPVECQPVVIIFYTRK